MPKIAATNAPGLCAIYAALLTDGEDRSCALGNTEDFLPIADQILDHDLFEVSGPRRDAWTDRLLKAAQPAIAEGTDREAIIARQAFRVGVATCWRLMTQINGAGAR